MGDKITKSLYISYNAITEPIVQSQVIPYLKQLSKRGIRFYLLTFEKTRMKKEEKDRIRDMLRKEFQDRPDLNWFSLNYHKTPTLPATFFDIVMGCIYSVYIMIRNKIDVVHARAIVAALAGYPAAKILSKKFIFDTRGIDSEEYVDAGLWRRNGLKHKVVGFLEKFITKHSDHIIVLTKKFGDIMRERYPSKKNKLSIIPCAVDIEKFTPAHHVDQNKFILVYMGSLGTWYMFDEMLDFFKTAFRYIKNIHFLLLTQTDHNYTKELIRRKKLNNASITVDHVSYDRVPERLWGCKAGIFFIKPVFSKLSSSPVKFGEYLASGLPVIINRGIGDTEEIVRTNRVGVIVENFNENCYHNALEELKGLINDKDTSFRCRKTAEKYLSLKNAIETYGKIYANLYETRAYKL